MTLALRWMRLRAALGWFLIGCGQACLSKADPEKRQVELALYPIIHPIPFPSIESFPDRPGQLHLGKPASRA